MKGFLRMIVAALLLTVLHGATASEAEISRIALASCNRQYLPQPIWPAINAYHPQAFLFLGDNVYADTRTADGFASAYARLAATEGYRQLTAQCPVYATWDDHDYGEDDRGAEFPAKDISRKAFLDFFAVPRDSPRRRHEGVYDAVTLGPPERRIQVLLLDTRWFRSPWTSREGARKRYATDDNPTLTILGEEQWRWLEAQLREPARLRILVSSIQVIDDEHEFETWGQFPRERERLIALIARVRADGVLIVSGDRHYGEISRLVDGVPYPLYDFTTSGMTHSYPGAANSPNSRRVGAAYGGLNFGTIGIDWTQPDPEIRLELRDVDGSVRQSVALHLGDLAATHE